MKKTKAVLIAVAFALVLTVAIGSTIAYFQAQKTITNVFVVGDGVDVEFDEDIDPSAKPASGDPNKNEFPLIPGKEFVKDPYITVGETSEDCYLFVKIVPTGDEADKLLYEIETGWAELEGATDVYFQKVQNVSEETVIHVFKDGKLTIDPSLTQEELEAIVTIPEVAISFYAIQMDGFETEALAWAELNK